MVSKINCNKEANDTAGFWRKKRRPNTNGSTADNNKVKSCKVKCQAKNKYLRIFSPHFLF